MKTTTSVVVDAEQIKRNIAARKALGMTADQYQRHLENEAYELRNRLSRLQFEMIQADLQGNSELAERKLAEYHQLGGK